MSRNRVLLAFGSTFLALSALASAAGTEVVPAAPGKGFHYPYLLRLPEPLAEAPSRALLVEPNNTGRGDDDLAAHLEAAKQLAELPVAGVQVVKNDGRRV